MGVKWIYTEFDHESTAKEFTRLLERSKVKDVDSHCKVSYTWYPQISDDAKSCKYISRISIIDI